LRSDLVGTLNRSTQNLQGVVSVVALVVRLANQSTERIILECNLESFPCRLLDAATRGACEAVGDTRTLDICTVEFRSQLEDVGDLLQGFDAGVF
jgi:hypothetical protein